MWLINSNLCVQIIVLNLDLIVPWRSADLR